MVDWKNGLSPEQVEAARHFGGHGLLLAGPGTGKTKTITHRAMALVVEHGISPMEILILTFTRLAAHQLKSEIRKVLEPLGKGYPHVSTLHSFALRQLLINSSKITSLPKPLRIADDWDERYIVCENLKSDLSEHLGSILPQIRRPLAKIRALFAQMSADWETLRIEQDERERMCRDPKFIGAWNEHRQIFGYTLRAELVYQLKKCLEQVADFKLEREFAHILVDEYQDLNACDLAVIEELTKKSGELFVAGDDDQSIYGFRFANPIGIRVFPDKYQAKRFDLETCYRCDKTILELGEFVANLDYQRLPKRIRPREAAEQGHVSLVRFDDQFEEAKRVAERCKALLAENGETGILILTRSDDKCRMSQPIVEALESQNVRVAVRTEESPLDCPAGRRVVCFLRLAVDSNDSLALYSLLCLEKGIGEESLNSVRQIAKKKGVRFHEALAEIEDNPDLCSSARLLDKLKEIRAALEGLCKHGEKSLSEQVADVVARVVQDSESQKTIQEHFEQLIEETEVGKLSDLLAAISTTLSRAEQELVEGAVNVMTMHKAKGLTADVVFVVGAEAQFIPGKNLGQKAEDERRLLYVSLTRARHHLYITYCRKRIGTQAYCGSDTGNPKRELTPFLVDSFLKPQRM